MLAATRALAVRADDVCVTRGSQMALSLVARALVRPGDVVAVERLGYRPAWEAFRAAGADVIPIPIDAEGIDVSALAALHDRTPVRAVYLFLQSVVPTVPASFLTFVHAPLYKFYVGLPHLWGLSTLEDQQMAGLIMKIGAGMLLWALIAVLFFRWAADEERKQRPRVQRELDQELARLGLSG